MALLVNDVTPTVQYTATASQTTFAYPFAVFEDADLKVYKVASGDTPDDITDLLTLATHYTVTGAGTTSGGNVVLVTGATVGDVITIKRDLAVKRTTDYQNLGDLASESFNVDLDKLVMMVQQQEEAFGRSISLQESTQTPTTFDIDDPVANYYAIAKADLSGIAWAQLQSSGDLTVSAFAETYLNDTTASETRTTIGAAGLVDDNTFSGINTFTKTQYLKKGADIASANDLILLADGNSNDITGTITVNGMTDGIQNEIRHFHADGVFILKHNTAASAGFSSLFIVQGAADITTAANDEFDAIYDGTVWRIVNYDRADGTSVIATPAAAGRTIQVVNIQDGEVATGTTVLPLDDTIPQNTEGDEYITLAITPTSATNKLKIEVIMNVTSSAAGPTLGIALFQDSTVGALAAVADSGSIGLPENISFIHYMTAGTTSSTTFKIRAGSNIAGTTAFNGQASARRYGGVYASSITITEVQT